MTQFIQDVWTNLQGYYQDFIVVLPKMILAIIVFSILLFIANQGKKIVNRKLTQRMDDPLLARFLARIVKATIVVFALMIVMKIIGLADIAAGLITGASVSAIVIGFAFKDIGENFLAGIMLAFNRPFRVGDTVELDNVKGKVMALNMRTSHLKTFDGKDVYIPNASVIKNPVVNYTIDGYIRQEFDIGLDYGSDIEEAKAIIEKEMMKIGGVLKEDKTTAVIIGDMTASTLNLTVQYWLNTFDTKFPGQQIRMNAVKNTLSALDEAGFYLPGDIVELKNYNEKDLLTKANQEQALN